MNNQYADNPLRGFLQLGFFVGVCGFVSAFYQDRNTAEFVLSVCSGLMGVFIVVGSVVVLRWLNRN
jgi:hypothetical protein